VLSGCIPVLLDGDVPRYGNFSTPWAFRKAPKVVSTNELTSQAELQLSQTIPHKNENILSGVTSGVTSGGGNNVLQPSPYGIGELDYSEFCVFLSSAAIERGELDIVQTLRSISDDEIQRLREALDRAAPLFRYSPFQHTSAMIGSEDKKVIISGSSSSGAKQTQNKKKKVEKVDDVSDVDAFEALYKIVEVAHQL
jgi:hypothetical protein